MNALKPSKFALKTSNVRLFCSNFVALRHGCLPATVTSFSQWNVATVKLFSQWNVATMTSFSQWNVSTMTSFSQWNVDIERNVITQPNCDIAKDFDMTLIDVILQNFE